MKTCSFQLKKHSLNNSFYIPINFMLKIKKDKFKNARSGRSHLLKILCSKCFNQILVYQKDWQWTLMRLYFDRILEPKEMKNLIYKDIQNIDILRCKECQKIIWVPYIYEKESRKAFRLVRQNIIKKEIFY